MLEWARNRGDWTAHLDAGNQLHLQGEYGEPRGLTTYLMEIAAGSLGKRFEAVFYNKLGLQLVAAGTTLEAKLLVNGMYSRHRYGAQAAALDLAVRYENQYDTYPAEARFFRPRIRYYTGIAHEDRGDIEKALACYKDAAAEAGSLGDQALAGMIQVDLAHAHLLMDPPEIDLAEQFHNAVDPETLTERGAFAYLAVLATIHNAKGRYAQSDEALRRALEAADHTGESLISERGRLTLLQAKNAAAQGDPHRAMVTVWLAVQGLEQISDRRGLADCERFMQQILCKQGGGLLS
jgi:tetratricopeptide (TPR) repeat protein